MSAEAVDVGMVAAQGAAVLAKVLKVSRDVLWWDSDGFGDSHAGGVVLCRPEFLD